MLRALLSKWVLPTYFNRIYYTFGNKWGNDIWGVKLKTLATILRALAHSLSGTLLNLKHVIISFINRRDREKEGTQYLLNTYYVLVTWHMLFTHNFKVSGPS